MIIDSDYFNFALEEAEKLKKLSNLTYAQKFRLDWIPNINSEKEFQIVADFPPHATTSFEMVTLALISDFITAEERGAVLNRYFDLFDAALSASNFAELGNRLTLAAYWNMDPTIRARLTEVAHKARAMYGLSIPEQCVNSIAAEI